MKLLILFNKGHNSSKTRAQCSEIIYKVTFLISIKFEFFFYGKVKVQVFWEGNKNLKKFPPCINIKTSGSFFKFCGLLTIS